VALDKLMLGVALGKRDEDTLTTLAGRLARLDRTLNAAQQQQVREVSGGQTLATMAAALLGALDPDAVAEKAAGPQATGQPDAAAIAPEQFAAAQRQLIDAACAPFDKPALRATLATLKRENEQTLDTVTIDKVTGQGFDAAAKVKAEGLVNSFRDYLAQHQAE